MNIIVIVIKMLFKKIKNWSLSWLYLKIVLYKYAYFICNNDLLLMGLQEYLRNGK